jgi:hypothetical protein
VVKEFGHYLKRIIRIRLPPLSQKAEKLFVPEVNWRSSIMLLYSTQELTKYKVLGKEDILGEVSGFLFDTTTWKLEFLRGKRGFWLNKWEFVIPVERLRKPDNVNKIIPTDILEEEIECLPSTNWLSVHFGKILENVKTYWRIGKFPRGLGQRLPSTIDSISSKLQEEPSIPQVEHSVHPQLRSKIEFEGYRVDAKDGVVGEIEDLIIDVKDWIISYMIVSAPDTNIMMPTKWINEADPNLETLKLNQNKGFVLGSRYRV